MSFLFVISYVSQRNRDVSRPFHYWRLSLWQRWYTSHYPTACVFEMYYCLKRTFYPVFVFISYSDFSCL